VEVLVVAGDPSGDIHAADLARHLKRGGARVVAVGGVRLKAEADEFIEDLASRGVTGFWEPVAKLGFLVGLLSRLKQRVAKAKAVVCVDFYGFNRRVLSLASAAGKPSYYYVSPQVWASRPGRVKVLKRLVRRMLVIFPFEEALYKEAGVPCSFVGHPLLDHVPEPVARKAPGRPLVVGLLPGSRPSEISRLLPLLLDSFALLRRHFPESRAEVFAADGLPDAAYAQALNKENVEIVRDANYRRRSQLDLALISSGTATLETALLGVPMVVVYKLSWPTYLIARAIIHVPFISMANILAGKELAPELIQHHATPKKVAAAARGLLDDPRKYKALRAELAGLRSKLGRPGAAQRAAEAILRDLRA
jgi:lipid-A-disaccharide synthase